MGGLPDVLRNFLLPHDRLVPSVKQEVEMSNLQAAMAKVSLGARRNVQKQCQCRSYISPSSPCQNAELLPRS